MKSGYHGGQCHNLLLLDVTPCRVADKHCTASEDNPASIIRPEVRGLRFPPRLKRVLQSSGLLHGVKWFETDVSGLHVSPTVKSQTSWTAWTLKLGPMGNPETSVLNHLTPRENPEDGRIEGRSKLTMKKTRFPWNTGICCTTRGQYPEGRDPSWVHTKIYFWETAWLRPTLQKSAVKRLLRHTDGVCTHDKYDATLIGYNDNLISSAT